MLRNRSRILVILILTWLCAGLTAQVRLCAWNIANFGKSKNDSEIVYIANTLRNFDVVAIVEVVAGKGGAQAVARLADELNRKGAKWDYTISDPTTGSPNKSERYAFLWKTAVLKKKGDAWLEKNYSQEMEREPYFIRLIYKEKEFTLAAFHAIPKSKQPETEIKYLKFMPALYPGQNILFVGDFNCPESHTVFNPLKTQGFQPVLSGQRTSLKQKCVNGEYLASEYDNIFYHAARNTFIRSGIVHFYKDFVSLPAARMISDHVPVYFEFEPWPSVRQEPGSR
jgi:deoxyribonuclease-1-like protein